LLHFAAVAGPLPQACRTAFKCERDGKVVYTDAPCKGGQRVETQPTSGLDTSSGKKRVGTDVRAEQLNASTEKALKPIFGETAEQRATRHHRAPLKAKSKARCAELDQAIPREEAAKRQARGDELSAAQRQLFKLRGEYRALGC
jgi:hypothetical protein